MREKQELAAVLRDATSLEGLADKVHEFGHEAMVRVALAAAREVLPTWDRLHPGEPAPREAIAAVEAWLAERTRERAAVDKAAAVRCAVEPWGASTAAHHAALAVGKRPGDALAKTVQAAIHAAAPLCLAKPGSLLAAIRAEVSAWALGPGKTK